MKPIFLDTVGLLAIWDQSDKWHETASSNLRKADPGNGVYLTTSFVLLECGNAAARKPFRPQIRKLRLKLDSAAKLVVPSDADLAEAWDAYDRGLHGNAGIVDQVSFVVMRRLELTRAFTNDNHFRAAGFECLF